MNTSKTDRLPTLYEVLNRQTSTPVDLWSFYTFLSQYPYAINFLDFWIDTMAHLRLCKDYVKGIRQSVTEWEDSQEKSKISDGNTNGNMDNARAAEIPENRESMSSSLLLEALMNDGFLDFEDSKRVSQFLQGQTDSPRLTRLLESWQKHTDQDIEDAPFRSPLTGLVDDFLKTQAHGSQKAHITSKQLLSNAQTIVDTYLRSPIDSPRYLINLPDHMRQQALHMVVTEQRHDPDVFEPLKSLAFQFLEMECFPQFLTSVALHNLHDDLTKEAISSRSYDADQSLGRTSNPFSHYTSLSRIVLGMGFLWLGLWLGYVLIFLDYNRGIRVTTIVLFFLGFYFIWTGIYKVDILYALCGVTQSLVSNELVSSKDLEIGLNRNSANHRMGHRAPVFLRLLGGTSRLVKIRNPLVNGMIKRRAWWCLFLIAMGTGIFTVIFSCVPGYRL
ncbi:LAFA_0G17040g1_1 [Lachancea sp. 'fantastica']|nr:LAFA_0G17040g1_1 [Lachancea sp. 'fantastica']